MNLFNIERTYRDRKVRRWPNIYFCIDLHDVILQGKYNLNNTGASYFPNCLNVLRQLNKHSDFVLILWTSGHATPTQNVLADLTKEGITFKYVNENLDCPNDHLCDFSRKFYMNILLDDKAGFEGETDWVLIERELRRVGEWIE